MEQSLKELRAKAKELRAKVSSAPISRASADQLKSEIAFFERAEKADATRELRMSNLAKGRESKAVAPAAEVKKNQKSTLVKKVSDTTAAPAQKVKRTKKTNGSSEE